MLCKIKIIYYFETKENDKAIKEIKFRIDHNKSYKDHSYYRSEVNINPKNTIKKKLNNIGIQSKEIAYSNPNKFAKSRDLEEYFMQGYGNIKIDINQVS